MYQVTFTYCGYVANVLYNNANSEEEAIESAKLYNSNKYDDVRAIPTHLTPDNYEH